MLACYDGQGAFYKPHMDSMDDDPRLVTAIFYLVDDKWDGRLEADGGNLIWWTVTEVRPSIALSTQRLVSTFWLHLVRRMTSRARTRRGENTSLNQRWRHGGPLFI